MVGLPPPGELLAARGEFLGQPLHGYDYADTPLWAGIYLLFLTIGNLATADLTQITRAVPCRAVKRKLKMLRYRPVVIDGCLAGTDLVMDA
ncbi:hypothetical protein ACFVT2_26830 [Streptomyces sp. NPDC058000]|uniref:hypothetical protein n=1 Tax=Streptomyces sp. NPDC058000 TaxID=3346299 RepID=UPI0036E41C02